MAKEMTFEEAKSQLQAAISGQNAKYWVYTDAVKTILDALNQEPFGFVTERCAKEMHANDHDENHWMWSISAVVIGCDPKLKHVVPVYLWPISTATATNSPVIPDGWKLVPIEPTESMIVDGFESEPDSFFSAPDVWKEYSEMSGCRQAAHRARLCYKAMLSAAPQQPVSDGWVKCSDRLPEENGPVLVHQEGGIIFCAEYEEDDWFCPDEFPNVPKQGCEITHWMPLPNPPAPEA
ncbi:DUF551 domain-containing protein [Mangrovibacter phragmitis]|uniref:DUF551 domain-containing protein n=1 Tax=Mangrovibacter phragmitis TaxID=1691903 RepID=UPI003369C062